MNNYNSSFPIGQIVVVAGGAGLLGQAFVRAIARTGGIPIIADIDEDKAKYLAKKINSENNSDTADYIQMNITSKTSVKNALNCVLSKHKNIDALVNSAYPRNSEYGRKFEDVTYESFCENLNLHLGGYFLTAQQFAEYFKTKKRGSIITVASIYGVVSPRFDIYKNTKMTMPVEYSAIKSALIHLNKYMMAYYKGSKIRFNCISPGGILSDQPEEFLCKYNEFGQKKGMLYPEDIAKTLIYLLSPNAEFINGQNIIIDDGWSGII